MAFTTDVDPAKYIINCGGANMSGYADGSYVTVERNEDLFSDVTGADGFTTRIKSNNLSGLVTLTLLQSSPSNTILMAFYLLDESNNTGIFPITLKNLLGTEVASSAAAWVRKIPSLEQAKEVTNRVWVVACADLSIFAGGNALFQGN